MAAQVSVWVPADDKTGVRVTVAQNGAEVVLKELAPGEQAQFTTYEACQLRVSPLTTTEAKS